jgi:very-short-patch-repair endonuclease
VDRDVFVARRWGQPLKTKQATLKRSRGLRRRMTEAELILWSKLKDDQLGARFVRQHPIGPYFADFACRRQKLVVEIDGETHSTPEERAHDTRRTAFIETHGWGIVRFWNHEVRSNLRGVAESIQARLLRE